MGTGASVGPWGRENNVGRNRAACSSEPPARPRRSGNCRRLVFRQHPVMAQDAIAIAMAPYGHLLHAHLRKLEPHAIGAECEGGRHASGCDSLLVKIGSYKNSPHLLVGLFDSNVAHIAEDLSDSLSVSLPGFEFDDHD